MKPWWRDHKRSARRRALREVRAGRPDSHWWNAPAPQALARHFDWLLPGLSSLILSVPLYWYVGSRPGWLDAAWPVSAVLLGFVIALLVFLLQAVGSGGLRAARTYRVIATYSSVAWPTCFSLLFIAWVAVIERFAGHRDARAWVSTWALGFFLAQWGALLVVFARTSRLLAPAGVTRALGRSLARDVEGAVVERLIRHRATEMYLTVWTGVARGALTNFDGFEVTADRAGHIDDFDLTMPVDLEAAGTAKNMCGMWVALGDRVRPGAALTSSTVAPDQSTCRRVRDGVRVRRQPRVKADWAEVFRDVIDLALSAVETGRRGDVDLALGIIVDGITKVSRTYRRHGAEYDVTTLHQFSWQPNEEDQMLEELSTMSSSAAASARADALVQLVALPYQLAVVAVDENVDLLLNQALVLWIRQAREARRIGDSWRTDAVNERIHRLSTGLAHRLISDFEKAQLPLAKRVYAAKCYQRVNWFRATLLKEHVDAQDLGAFKALWSEVNSRGNTKDQLQDRRAVERQLANATDPGEKAMLAKRLAEATDIEGAFRKLLEARGWDWFRVGAWAAWQYSHGRINQDTWETVAPTLARPFWDRTVADRLSDIVGAREPVRELDSWDRNLQDITPSTDMWEPRDTEIALLWAALLILRDTRPEPYGIGTSAPPLPMEDAVVSYADKLIAHIDRVQHRAIWHGFVGDNITAKADAVRRAINASKEAAIEQARARTPQATPAARSDGEVEGGMLPNGSPDET